MQPRGDQAGEMRHVDHQIGADAVGDLAEAREVDDARIGRAAGDDHRGLVLLGEPLDLVVIDAVIVGAHAVLHGVEPFAGEVGRRAVGEMAAGSEAETHDGVAGLQQRQHHGLVRLAPECGCTLAKLQLNRRLARSMASCSTTSTYWQPP